MSQAGKTRALPPLVHIRNPNAAGRPSVPPPSSGAVSEDHSGRAVPVDVVRRDLLAGTLSRDTEVLFTGLGDWTPAHEIPELWVAPAVMPPPDVDAPVDSTDSPRSSTSNVGVEAARKKGFGAGAIVGAIGAAVALLAVGAAAVYFVYFHYRPVAVQHLPKKCYVAVRVDLVDWAWFKPLADRIIPALEEASKPKVPPPVTGPAPPSLKERLKANAGIDLDRDVREIAMCVYEDKETKPSATAKDPLFGKRPIFVVGGRMKQGSIPAIYESIRTEGIAVGFRLDGSGDSAVIRTPNIHPKIPLSFVIGQAEDGSIIIAPSDASLAAAREQRTEEEARNTTSLEGKGALELVFDHAVWGLAAFGKPPATGPIDQDMMDALAKVQASHFGLTLGSAPRINMRLEMKSEPDAKLVETQLRKLLEAGQKEVSGASKDWAGEHAALSGARISREDNNVDIRVDFKLADVDRGATTLSEMIKDETSPLRAKILPYAAFMVGVGPKPLPPPSPSTSTSGSASGSPSIDPPDPGDD